MTELMLEGVFGGFFYLVRVVMVILLEDLTILLVV